MDSLFIYSLSPVGRIAVKGDFCRRSLKVGKWRVGIPQFRNEAILVVTVRLQKILRLQKKSSPYSPFRNRFRVQRLLHWVNQVDLVRFWGWRSCVSIDEPFNGPSLEVQTQLVSDRSATLSGTQAEWYWYKHRYASYDPNVGKKTHWCQNDIDIIYGNNAIFLFILYYIYCHALF